MKKEVFDIEMTFTEPVLGSASGDPEIHAEHIAANAPNQGRTDEEVAAVEAAQKLDEVERKMTVFPRDDQGLFVYDYQMRGFFKESLGVLIDMGEIEKNRLSKWMYKRAVDSLVFINPRRIYLRNEDGKPYTECTGVLKRPLRAETLQGPRIALAFSEQLPPGTTVFFRVTLLQPEKLARKGGGEDKASIAALNKQDLLNCLEYGSQRGWGQWRGGGYGRFEWSELAADHNREWLHSRPAPLAPVYHRTVPVA